MGQAYIGIGAPHTPLTQSPGLQHFLYHAVRQSNQVVTREAPAMFMKALVAVLGVLALTKLGTQEYLFRSGTKDVLINAYRDRAAAACQKDQGNQIVGSAPTVWARSTDVRVAIGKSDLDVWFWQVDDQLWNARYRNPYLYLTNGDRGSAISCEYDIVRGAAMIVRG
jgi:hypothetical protein